MTGHKVSGQGTVIATYQPAGPGRKIGTYVTEQPSEREHERQARNGGGQLVTLSSTATLLVLHLEGR